MKYLPTNGTNVPLVSLSKMCELQLEMFDKIGRSPRNQGE